ncbi:uncharacterized protein LOC120678796 [Panicum virgatum]|uniref:uncharacterized protein LOC120678796 n=1 Tax=Panicum virgatum TaxID=38727 RepID=UPI0019D52A9C|nr:uncharacterized protein LOC120678796 [Panicum virgatum]
MTAGSAWIAKSFGSSSTNSIASTWETGSMEEDGGSSSWEWFVARAGTGDAGGIGGGPNAGIVVQPLQAPQKSIGEARGILEHNRVFFFDLAYLYYRIRKAYTYENKYRNAV